MKKITRPEELFGKTIRTVFEGTQTVIVFDDNDWCVIEAIDAGPDAATKLEISAYGYQGDINNYLTADELLEADLLSKPQHDLLVKQQLASEAASKRFHAEKLLAEATRLEQLA